MLKKRFISICLLSLLIIPTQVFAVPFVAIPLKDLEIFEAKSLIPYYAENDFIQASKLAKSNLNKKEIVLFRESQIKKLISGTNSILSETNKVSESEKYFFDLARGYIKNNKASSFDIQYKDQIPNLLIKELKFKEYKARVTDIFAYTARKQIAEFVQGKTDSVSTKSYFDKIKSFKSFDSATEYSLAESFLKEFPKLKMSNAIKEIINGNIKDLEIFNEDIYFITYTNSKLTQVYVVPVKEKSTGKFYIASFDMYHRLNDIVETGDVFMRPDIIGNEASERDITFDITAYFSIGK